MIWKDEMASMFHLTIAALANFVIAFVHIVIPFTGEMGYVYFGTNELVTLESQGSVFPDLATLFFALIFAAFGLYCLSGAEIIRPLPLLNPALWFIGGIYTLRGLVGLFELFRGAGDSWVQIVFSTVSLTIGFMILIGMKIKK